MLRSRSIKRRKTQMWFFFTFSGGLKQIYTTVFETWEKSSQKLLIVGVLGVSLFQSHCSIQILPEVLFLMAKFMA